MTRADARSGLELVVRGARAEAALWRRLRYEAQADCREPLFNLYIGLARAMARRHWRRRPVDRLDHQDFEQLAYEGLLQAIDRYDPMRGVPFSAFARRRIAGNIADGVTRMSELDAQIGHRRRMEQERLRSLAAESASGAAPENAVGALSNLAVGLALGLMLEGTALLAGEGSADPGPTAYDSLEWRELQARLAREMARLPEKEAIVIRQHYENGLSFGQVADLLGLSRGRVSQLHRAALERLRKRLGRWT